MAYHAWVRRGFSAMLADVEATSADVELGVDARITAGGDDSGVAPFSSVRLRGPGHVAAVDPSLIRRVEPPPGATDVLTRTLPYLEFREADLAWRFSPGGAPGQRVAPWFGVICVRADAVRLTRRSGDGRMILTLASSAVATLPRLGDRWAWAHAQSPEDGADEGRWTSRVLCPVSLAPATRYLCAWVPVFRAGVEAALALPGADFEPSDSLELAWGDGEAAELTLPAWYTWTFQTGDAEDFRSLAERMRVVAPPDGLGERPLALLDPRPALDVDTGGASVRFAGALVTAAVPPLDTPDDLRLALAGQWRAVEGEEDPLVLPPAYGSAHAGCAPEALASGVAPPWMADINLHPAARAAAGLGAAAVRAHQEELAAAAWDQAATARTAGHLLRQGQVAVEIGRRHAARIARLADPSARISLLARMHRVVAGERGTWADDLERTGAPEGLFHPRLRRICRPGAPVHRALLRVSQPALRAADGGGGRSSGPRSAAAGVVGGLLRSRGDVLAPARSWVQPHGMNGSFAVPPRPKPRDLDLPSTVDRKPDAVAAARRRLRLRLPDVVMDAERSIPGALQVTPVFDVPLGDWLGAVDPELLVPGLPSLPDDSIVLVRPNRQFIESVMVGANDELVRELRWRGFPVDPRGTSFRVFWGGSEGVDIAAIDHWTHALGDNEADPDDVPPPNGATAGVIAKGGLLKRFPDLAVYVGRRTAAGEVETVVPVISARLGADVLVALFDVEVAEPGWWLVFEEDPAAPRFATEKPKNPGALGNDSAAVARATAQRPIRFSFRLGAS